MIAIPSSWWKPLLAAHDAAIRRGLVDEKYVSDALPTS
jgi:hypothetical protein